MAEETKSGIAALIMEQLALFAQPVPGLLTDDEIDDETILGDHKVGLRIQLGKHGDKWMWATSFHCPGGGQGYGIGPKWGNFADSIVAAGSAAIEEIRSRAAKHEGGKAVIKLLNENFNPSKIPHQKISR